MRVRMKGYVSGTRDGEPWPAPGEELELPDEEAVSYLGSGLVVPVSDKAESAAVDTRPAVRTGRPLTR